LADTGEADDQGEGAYPAGQAIAQIGHGSASQRHAHIARPQAAEGVNPALSEFIGSLQQFLYI